MRFHRGTDPILPKYTEGTVRHPDSVMVWGAFGYYGIGKLVVLPKNVTVNQERHLELLPDHLEDCFNSCQSKIFQHNGALAHRSKLVLDWLDFVGVDYVKDWPVNSLDLNPIENLWTLMKARLRGRKTQV